MFEVVAVLKDMYGEKCYFINILYKCLMSS